MISTARRIFQGCRAPADLIKVHLGQAVRVPQFVNHQLRNTPTRVGLYARCSTLDQHPEAQIEQLRLLAQQRGWDVVGEYVDHGQSGRRDRRPELDRLMGDVQRGRVHAVAVVRFDRWARSVRHLVQTLDDFRCRNVDFISMSDGITRPAIDRSRYTLGFGESEVLHVRFDCNRGRGTWKSSGAGNLEFGPLALTRAMCPPGSLHDQLVRQWPHVRSYVIRDGRLFLSLMADGGIIEFEPAP